MSELLHPVIQHHLVNTLGWPTLRPLQASAASPVLSGGDCLLLAPTAGGKTEAALFPLLTRMASEGWAGTSVLYICPLRALLNNLYPRLASYAGWLGRTAQRWHGDVGQTDRRRILRDRHPAYHPRVNGGHAGVGEDRPPAGFRGSAGGGHRRGARLRW